MNNLFFANNENTNTRYLEQKNSQSSNSGNSFTPPKPPSQKSFPKKATNKKINLKQLKKNTCKSLNEVEYFLNNFQKFTNCIKLYKILK